MFTIRLLFICLTLRTLINGFEIFNGSDCDCSLANLDENLEEYPKYEKHLGICASTGDRFLNKCWMEAYNRIFNKSVTTTGNSSCPENCPCKSCEDNLPLYNPICVFDPNTGYFTTILNQCDLQCQQCLHNVLVLHCGPCGVKCSKIFNRVDCLAPPGSSEIKCIIKITIPQIERPLNAERCDCADKPGALTCTHDSEGNMITFMNPCFVHCNPLFIVGGLKILYGQEGMGWCPCKSS